MTFQLMKLFDIRVIHVADHHLRRAARGAARLDRACRAVADLQEPHEPRRFATARQALALTPEAGEIGAGAGTVLEQPRLAHPKVHDPAIADQIVGDRLDEAGMRLRMFIGAGRFGQLAGLVIHVVMALARTIDAVGPVQAGVEPLRAVRRGHLRGQHETHLVIVGLGIGLGGEVTALPAPIGPGAGQPVEDLLGRGLATETLVLGQLVQGSRVGHRAPQELGHALFLDRLQPCGNAGLAEILLRDDVRGDLAPTARHFHAFQLEHGGAVGIANLGGRGREFDLGIRVLTCLGKFSFDLHFYDLPRNFCPFRKADPSLCGPHPVMRRSKSLREGIDGSSLAVPCQHPT